jgi:hypothetical protein
MVSGEKGVGEGHTTDEARTTQPRGGKDPYFVHGYPWRYERVNAVKSANYTKVKVQQLQRTLYLAAKANGQAQVSRPVR